MDSEENIYDSADDGCDLYAFDSYFCLLFRCNCGLLFYRF
uniref:Uncharacterized protein n=1 Tax=Heterorhabditis bacteriophora TaxID=37862 RepID=A0A1I7WZ62_HETBA